MESIKRTFQELARDAPLNKDNQQQQGGSSSNQDESKMSGNNNGSSHNGTKMVKGLPLKDMQASKLFDVKGLTVLIVGGTSGLGYYAARALAANGAKVIIASENEEHAKQVASELKSEAQEYGGSATGVCFDQTSVESINHAVDQVQQEHGGQIDLLILAAATPGNCEADCDAIEKLHENFEAGHKQLKKIDAEHWATVMKTNLWGKYATIVGFLPLLKKGQQSQQDYSSQILLISDVAHHSLTLSKHNLPYCLSKGAVTDMAQDLARMFAKSRIRVNSIAPGWFPSEIDEKGQPMHSNYHEMENVAKGTTAGRCGSPHEWCSLVLGLATRAQTYINGQEIKIEGGHLLCNPSKGY